MARTTRPLAPAPSSSDSVYPGTVHVLIAFLTPRDRPCPREYRGTPGHPALAVTDTFSAAAVAVPPFLAHLRISARDRLPVRTPTCACRAARPLFVL